MANVVPMKPLPPPSRGDVGDSGSWYIWYGTAAVAMKLGWNTAGSEGNRKIDCWLGSSDEGPGVPTNGVAGSSCMGVGVIFDDPWEKFPF